MITHRSRNFTEPWLKRSSFTDCQYTTYPNHPVMQQMMKFKNLVTGVFIIAILAVSCEKDPQFVEHEETTVEGRLLSAADRSPIAHGKVLLLVDDLGTLTSAIWYGRSFGVRNVITTDAQGRFSYRFKHSEDSVYAVAAEAEGYFPNRNSGGYPYPNWRATGRGGVKRGYINYYTRADDGPREFINEKGIVYNAEIRLAPEGWIKYRIINQDNKYDYINIKAFTGGGLGPFAGHNVNQTVYDINRGGLTNKIYIYYRYNTVVDSIYVEPHDTVLYELEY